MIKELFDFDQGSPSLIINENYIKSGFWISFVIVIVSISLLIFTEWKKTSLFLFGGSLLSGIICFALLNWNRGKINYHGDSTKKELIAENSLLKQELAECKGKYETAQKELERFVRKKG